MEQIQKGRTANALDYLPPSLKERLQQRLSESQRHVSDIEAALALLERNPDMETLITLLGRTGI